MIPFSKVSGRPVPLPIDNVDTDQIIPASFLKVVDREGLADGLFRGCLAVGLGVGRIGEQEQHPSPSQLGQPGKIGQPAVDRRLVKLEIARVNHQADRGRDAQAYAIGDRVANAKELDFKGRQIKTIAADTARNITTLRIASAERPELPEGSKIQSK